MCRSTRERIFAVRPERRRRGMRCRPHAGRGRSSGGTRDPRAGSSLSEEKPVICLSARRPGAPNRAGGARERYRRTGGVQPTRSESAIAARESLYHLDTQTAQTHQAGGPIRRSGVPMLRRNSASVAVRGFSRRASSKRARTCALLARNWGASRRHCSKEIVCVLMVSVDDTRRVGRLGRLRVARRCLVARRPP